MPLPTFVIAGAQRSGTSSLAGYLKRHPQACVGRPKELHYFDYNWGKGLDWYLSRFKVEPEHRQIGEATPVYMYDDLARSRMIETIPNAAVILILRDPIKRAYSHFWHAKREGYEEVDSFEKAIELEPERLASGTREIKIRNSYLDRGRFIDQIEALEPTYGAGRLYVTLLDDLIENRVETLVGVFSFLGLDTDHANTIDEQWQARYRVEPTGADATPDANPTGNPPMSPDTRARLVEHFRPFNDRLSAWLGRDLSAWNKA